MQKSYIFHPFLFTMYAVLAPTAQNVDIVGIAAIRALIASLIFSIVLVNVVRLIFKHRQRAGLLTTGILLVFFSYGHVSGLLPGSSTVGSAASMVLVLGSVGFVVLWAIWVLRKLQDVHIVTNFLNIVTGILLIFPFYSIITYQNQTAANASHALEYQSQIWRGAGLEDLKGQYIEHNQPLPDIYYIIVDGYTRQDTLMELYDYDNSDFIHFLEENGFYVAPASRSNYAETVESITSALNMAQINTVLEYNSQSGMENMSGKAVGDMLALLLKNNRLQSFLKENGYSLVSYDSGYVRTTIKTVDFFEQSPDVKEFDAQLAFELILLDSTFGKLFTRALGEDHIPYRSTFDDHRKRILYALNNLSKYADREGDYFIFAHIISPHTPYVFGPDGEERYGVDPFTLLEVRPGMGWKPEMYTDQVTYINKLLKIQIEQILARSETDPIIIVQADHSSRAYNIPNPPDELRVKLLLPILNAYHLPGVDETSLIYPDITPVNSFRVVLNHYFQTQMSLLEDVSYIYEERNGKAKFVNACEAYQACR